METAILPGLRFVRKLGEGGMGIVFEGEYPERNERVAVKTMQHCDGVALLRFKNEFRNFANVVHPNLVALHELVEANGEWFLVMELLHGVDFGKALRGHDSGSTPTEPTATVSLKDLAAPMELAGTSRSSLPPVPDSPLVRTQFAQLAYAIHAIHCAGHLHRDIKPANIFVEPDGRVVLLDFGVALAVQKSRLSRIESSDCIVGTPRYIAPELLSGALPSPASDWYAFGVMMHDFFTGVPVFNGPPAEMFRQKLELVQLQTRATYPFVTPQLAELIDGLLGPDPAKRPGFGEVMRALDLPLPQAQGRRPMAALGLVGRQAEQATMREAARVARFDPACLVLRGRSGVGKSALLAQVLQELEDDGAIVLSGRCYEHESVPFKSVDRIVDSLATLLERDPALRESLRPPYVSEFVRAFPVLREAWSNQAQSVVVASDWTAVRRRALNALSDVLRRLAARSRLVCCIDDLQWGDVESAEVLAALTDPGGPPGLVIASFREEEADNAAVKAYLRAIEGRAQPVVTVQLAPLSDADCQILASQVAAEAGVTDDRVVEWARLESGGEPYFLHELLFFAAGAEDPRALKGLKLRDVLQKRVERLTDEQSSILCAIAFSVSGAPSRIAESAGRVLQPRRALGELRAAHLTRSRVDGGVELIDTFHDKVREAVLTACSSEAAQRVHAALFSAWSEWTGAANSRVMALAHHGLRAGDGVPPQAIRRALLDAARLAEETFNPAEQRALLLELRARSSTDQPFGPDQTMALGRACSMVGDVEEATRSFFSVVTNSQDAELRAQARYGLARVKLGQFDSDGVLVASNLALKELGLTALTRSLRAALGAVGRWFFAWLAGSRGRSTNPNRDALAARLYFTAAYASFFQLNPPLFVQGILRGYPLITRLGARREGADWYSVAAALCTVLGLHRLGHRLVDRAMAIAVQSKDPGAIATARYSSSLVIDMSGDPIKGAERALEVMREQAQWLDNADFLTLVSNFSCIEVMRGHARLAWMWLERALRRVDDPTLSASCRHPFRCWAAPVLAMLGRADEGLAELKNYEDIVRADVMHDVWRNVALIAHRTLLSELIGASDDVLEALFASHRALGRKPRAYPHQMRHFYVAKMYRRIDQALRSNSAKAERARLRDAIAELKSISKHPTLRAHLLVGEGALRWVNGKSPQSVWDEALKLAKSTDNPWVQFEINLLQYRRAKREGRAAFAEDAHAVALTLARSHGWVLFERRLEQAR